MRVPSTRRRRCSSSRVSSEASTRAGLPDVRPRQRLLAQTFDPLRCGCRRRRVDRRNMWTTRVGRRGLQRHGGVLAYREREKSAGELNWVDRAAGAREHGPACEYIHPWLSPDERRAVVEIADPDTQACRVDARPRPRIAIAVHRRSGTSHFPVWSPDGRTVLFDSDAWPWTLLAKRQPGGAEENF